jgi:hypothetical protein
MQQWEAQQQLQEQQWGAQEDVQEQQEQGGGAPLSGSAAAAGEDSSGLQVASSQS